MEGQYMGSTMGGRSRDSLVDIATGYGLDGRGLIPGKVRNFLISTKSTPALGPTQPPLQWVPE
jgi:hypothetical protein